jgi:sorbitol-specific phosphotransferase system component IIA
MTIFVGCKGTSIRYKALGQGIWLGLQEIGYITLIFRVQDVVELGRYSALIINNYKKETLSQVGI